MQEKYLFEYQGNEITIYKNGDMYSLTLALQHPMRYKNTFRYDGHYSSKDKDASYHFVNMQVKVSATDTKIADKIYKAGIFITTAERELKSLPREGITKFKHKTNNLLCEVTIQNRDLLKLFSVTGIHKNDYKKHNAYGNCGVMQVVSGGLVNPR